MNDSEILQKLGKMLDFSEMENISNFQLKLDLTDFSDERTCTFVHTSFKYFEADGSVVNHNNNMTM